MTSASMRLSRVAIAALTATAFAAPVAAGQVDYFLKIPPIEGESGDKHKQEIDVLSWSWGETRAGYELENVQVKSWSTSAAGSDRVPGEAEITLKGNAGTGAKPHRTSDVTLKRGMAAATVEREMKESGEKGGTEDINIGVGELQEVTISKSMDKSTPKLAEAVATGKHLDRPLPKGSVLVKVKRPWTGCRVGTRYPMLELGGKGQAYRLTDATIASCGAAAGDADDRPTEEVAFNYSKIE